MPRQAQPPCSPAAAPPGKLPPPRSRLTAAPLQAAVALPLVLPPSEGRLPKPLVPEGASPPGGADGVRGAKAGGGRGPARDVQEPRRAKGSCHYPPRVRLCPAASPAPAPAWQEGSSNSPASDGEGETHRCFLSAAHVPRLAKCRLMKFHANAPACHPVPRLQPPMRTPGHPGLQKGGSGGKTDSREEPEPPLMEVGGKEPRGTSSPSAAARPGALPPLGGRVPQSDGLS